MFKEIERDTNLEALIETIYKIDLPHCNYEYVKPDIRNFIDIFDTTLKGRGEDFELGHDMTIIGQNVIKKIKEGTKSHLIIMNFLDYHPKQDDVVIMKSPGVRITYDTATKEPISIYKLATTDKGRLYSGLVIKKG